MTLKSHSSLFPPLLSFIHSGSSSYTSLCKALWQEGGSGPPGPQILALERDWPDGVPDMYGKFTGRMAAACGGEGGTSIALSKRILGQLPQLLRASACETHQFLRSPCSESETPGEAQDATRSGATSLMRPRFWHHSNSRSTGWKVRQTQFQVGRADARSGW